MLSALLPVAFLDSNVLSSGALGVIGALLALRLILSQCVEAIWALQTFVVRALVLTSNAEAELGEDVDGLGLLVRECLFYLGRVDSVALHFEHNRGARLADDNDVVETELAALYWNSGRLDDLDVGIDRAYGCRVFVGCLDDSVIVV